MQRPSPRPGYWVTQILVWSAYALLNIVFTVLAGGPRLVGIAIAIGLSLLLIGASHALRAVMYARGWFEHSFLGLAWRLLLSTGALALAVQFIGSTLRLFVSPGAMGAFSIRVFVLFWINTTIVLMVWALAYASYKTFERWRSGEIDRWRTQALLREAELNLLKAQLDPHFVFNALNNIRAVILENPQRARNMLTHLSQSLRHVLQHSQRTLVSLREELAAVDDYLALIDLHTDGELSVTRSIDPTALDAQVPPLAVQLLIENAIKHGTKRRESGLGLQVVRSKDRVTIEVSNAGRLGTATSGVGLPNLRERLARAFGNDASCDLSEQGERVCARLSVPG